MVEYFVWCEKWPNEKEISHGGCRGKLAEVLSQWGCWLHRMVRPPHVPR